MILQQNSSSIKAQCKSNLWCKSIFGAGKAKGVAQVRNGWLIALPLHLWQDLNAPAQVSWFDMEAV
jgi:hypothetical protein